MNNAVEFLHIPTNSFTTKPPDLRLFFLIVMGMKIRHISQLLKMKTGVRTSKVSHFNWLQNMQNRKTKQIHQHVQAGTDGQSKLTQMVESEVTPLRKP